MNLFVPVLAACAVASGFGIRVVDPMVPALSVDLAVSVESASFLVTVFSVAYALGQPVLGPLGDGVGKVRMIVMCGAVVTALFVLCALASDFSTLALARGLSGFAAGGIIPLAIAAISEKAEAIDRQVALGRFLMASILGQMLGAAVAGVVAEWLGWRAVFALTAALVGAATAVAYLALPFESHPQGPSQGRMLSRYGAILKAPRALRLFGLVMAGAMAAYGIFPFVAAILRARFGTGPSEAGLVLAGFGLGGVLYALTVRQVIARLGTNRMSRIGGTGGALALAVLAVPLPWAWNVPAFTVLGFSYFMLHNTFQTKVTELVPESRGSAVSLFAFCVFAAQGIGPLFVGAGLAALPTAVVLGGLAVAIAGVGLLAPMVLGDKHPE